VMIEQHPTRAQASAILVRDGDVEDEVNIETNSSRSTRNGKPCQPVI
jgi:hypothetical protein